MGVYFEPYERAEQFLSTYIMKKFFLVVTFLAAFHSPVSRVSGQDQEPPLSCDDLKKIDPNHEQLKVKCGDEDEELTRSFGFGAASSLHSGGNRNRNTQVIYDGQCNDWQIVGLHDCPIAFNFAPYEHLCEAGNWWRKQWIHTEPMYILKPRLGSYFCRHTPRFFARFLVNLVVVSVVVVLAIPMVVVMAVSGIIFHSMGVLVRTIIEMVIVKCGGQSHNLCLEYYFMNNKTPLSCKK